MASTCDAFHLVQSGDECGTIASDAGISLADFYAWNPAVGTTCEYLGLGDYVCIDIIGVTPNSTTTTAATTTNSDGITTPTPIQTGMVATCNKFYLVQSGDECGTIASNEDISLDDFYSWNPAVGTNCTDLDVGDYVCVDIIGFTPTTTTSTPGDGITTPTPIQTGMVSTCNKFYLVQSGDECGTIASDEGISLDDFYSWNPAVGTSCQYLALGDYVCVDIIGFTPTTTTTSAGDGVTTPTPHQTGMVSDCDKFYLVQSGDECGTIASNEGITLANFYAWNPAVGTSCQYLGLGDYVCVGLL
jgi:LysM domain